MVTLNQGAVKYKSLKAAYEAAKKRNPELKWMTFYMRHRMDKPLYRAVRKYERKAA